MASNIQQIQADLGATAYGQKGGILLTDTSEVSGNFRTIVVLSAAAFTTLTSQYTKNGTTTATAAADWGTLPTGMVLSGRFTTVKLTSGSVLLVN